MKWTTKKPTVPGWYWCENVITGCVEVLKFNAGGDGAIGWMTKIYTNYRDGETWETPEQYDAKNECQWAGPLEAPIDNVTVHTETGTVVLKPGK